MYPAFLLSLSVIITSPFVRAGFIMSILNTLAILHTQQVIIEQTSSNLTLYTIIKLSCLDLSFVMSLALSIFIIDQWTQIITQKFLYNRSVSSFYLLKPPMLKQVNNYVPWLLIGIVNGVYMSPDWAGATHKLSVFCNLESIQEYVHTLIILALCTSHILLYLILNKLSLSTQRFVSIATAIIIQLINESILEGAYFGIHFFLSTISFQSLSLLFKCKDHLSSEKQGQAQVQNSESLSLKHIEVSFKSNHEHHFDLHYLPRQKRYQLVYLMLPLFILSTFLRASAVLANRQELRQNYNRSETAFGLKWQAFFLTQSNKLRSELLNETLENPWLNRQILGKIEHIWHSEIDGVLSMITSKKEAFRTQEREKSVREIQQDSPKPIVILITIDSLKADWFIHKKTPVELKHLKKLSQDSSTWFSSKVFSASTSTRFTLGSLIYGRYPSHLDWSKDRATHPSLIKETHSNLWERLAQQQVKSVYFASEPNIIRKSNGLGKGISQIVNFPPRPTFRVTFSPQIFDRLIDELHKANQNSAATMLFSHLLDAHHPFNGGQKVYKSKIKSHLSELAIIDHQIARLLHEIQQSPNRNRIWLIISSDHGQGFGRHHVQTHNASPYEHQARVPIWIHNTSLDQSSEKSNGPAQIIKQYWSKNKSWSSIDLHPTILELFTAPINPNCQGVSWWPLLSSAKQASLHQSSLGKINSRLTESLYKADKILSTRPLLSLNWYSRALYLPKKNIKFIEETNTQTLMLFDLKADPLERINLCTSQVKECQKKHEYLNRLVYTRGRQPIEFNEVSKH